MREINLRKLNAFRFGHATNEKAATGCSVVLCEQGAIAGVDVRGGAPGTRETDLLRSENIVEQVHGIFLSGGSAFGLEVGSGVMKFLEEKEVGFNAGGTKVPIVPGAILFDLHIGDSTVRPNAEMGYQACQDAYSEGQLPEGNVGAGTGASVGKAAGPDYIMKGGIGCYALEGDGVQIGSMVAVNSFGDIINPQDGRYIAGVYDYERQELLSTERLLIEQLKSPDTNQFYGNTSLGVVTTNAKLSKAQANKVASIAHDGFARTMRPSHTPVDGDAIFVLSTNEIEADMNTISMLATSVIEHSVLRAIRKAEAAYGLVSCQDILNRRGENQ